MVFINTWANIYKDHKNDKGEDIQGHPESIKFLEQVSRSLFLVNIVENDYVGGDLNKAVADFIKDNQEAINAL